MSTHKEYDVHLGNNIKHLMKAFHITQSQLADKMGEPGSHICNLLQRAEIDEKMLQRIAKALENGITVEMIKAYDHEDTQQYIINNYNQTIESGATGTYNKDDSQSKQTIEDGGTGTYHKTDFQEGSTQANYVAEQAFIYAEKNTQLEKLLLYYRMKIEPEEVEKEMQALKESNKQEQEEL